MWKKINKDGIPLPFLAFISVISLLVISGGILLYNSQSNKILYEKQNELAAISSIKTEEISKWRTEHLRDGKIISRIYPQTKLMFSFLNNNNQPELSQQLLHRMEAFTENYDYRSILIIDSAGVVRLAYPPDSSLKKPAIFTELQNSGDSEISLSRLHLSEGKQGLPEIDVQIPLFSSEHSRIGTILMRIDPYKTLYPLIQTWPTPSKSSETLLIMVEGDSVIYLNELRHRNNSALKLKIPLTNKELPASKAALGYEGVFEGRDYRGIKVISYLTRIPDSPWFLVAKVDKKEIYSPLKELILFIISTVFLLILSLTSFTVYYWRNKKVQYLKELNATKDKFFSIISHDLRSPFFSINGFANLLVDEMDQLGPAEVKRYSQIILDSSMNAMDLLKNLTEWSMLQTHRIKYNPKEIDMASIIDEVTGLVEAHASQKSITISSEVPSGLKIFADKDMIGTVLRNLISNSIKFSQCNGKIDISVVNSMNEIIVEVEDTGIGIKKEAIDKLFQSDKNVSQPGTQSEHGTGLGLILVKEFVSLHGGKVWVESEVGKGSRFFFTLPGKDGVGQRNID